MEETEVQHLDYDLQSAINYNKEDVPFEMSDITGVIAEIPGEADGPNWHWILVLGTEKFAYVTGGCDYTGWD